MAGLYVHIPFCKKACSYCNFHFTTGKAGIIAMLNAIEKETKNRLGYIGTDVIDSIYFGGGTPSIVDATWIKNYLDLVHQLFVVKSDAEITLEANPDDLNPYNLETWRQAGVNRLSIGLQSLFNDELQLMRRSHTAEDSMKALQLAQNAGFDSLNIDFIFGSPWLTDAMWSETLDWAFSCGANHISAYGLTVEPNTLLFRQIQAGKIATPSDERQANQYKMLFDTALKQNWDFYEISNLCTPGNRAKHNSSYWYGKKYLGIGPSAHSFDEKSRRWNVADNKKYVTSIDTEEAHWEEEKLTLTDQFNEFLLTRIRISEGFSMAEVEDCFPDYKSALLQKLQIQVAKKLVREENSTFRLTFEGRLYADKVTSDLMAE